MAHENALSLLLTGAQPDSRRQAKRQKLDEAQKSNTSDTSTHECIPGSLKDPSEVSHRTDGPSF